MFRKAGLYVFPDGKKIRLFAYDGDTAKEFSETTFAQQLIDFLEINLDTFRKAVNNLKKYDNNLNIEKLAKVIDAINFLADSFYVDKPVYSFLLKCELVTIGENISPNSIEDAVYYKNSGIKVLENMLNIQTFLFHLTYVYCTAKGEHSEKVYKLSIGRGSIFNCRFEEIVSVTAPNKTMFHMKKFSYPLTKGYRFETLQDYLWYVFINSLQHDVNLSVCQYCGHFFIPKTKRKTRYCDRLRTDDGRTCKDIGPAFIKKLKAEHSIVLSEYDKAINRNFKRVERFEEKLTDEKSGKDLDYNEYAEWHREASKARELWKNGDLSDEEVLKVIHQLD